MLFLLLLLLMLGYWCYAAEAAGWCWKMLSGYWRNLEETHPSVVCRNQDNSVGWSKIVVAGVWGCQCLTYLTRVWPAWHVRHDWSFFLTCHPVWKATLHCWSLWCYQHQEYLKTNSRQPASAAISMHLKLSPCIWHYLPASAAISLHLIGSSHLLSITNRIKRHHWIWRSRCNGSPCRTSLRHFYTGLIHITLDPSLWSLCPGWPTSQDRFQLYHPLLNLS
jgi:hypothetical protein